MNIDLKLDIGKLSPAPWHVDGVARGGIGTVASMGRAAGKGCDGQGGEVKQGA